MNVFKKLFGGASNKHVVDTGKAEYIKTELHQTAKPETPSKAPTKTQTPKFAELIQVVEPIGKPENVLHRVGYETPMPCIDVTPFFVEQLTRGNTGDILEYLRTFKNEPNSQTDTSGIQSDFDALLKLDFEYFIKAEPQAITELKAFYILNGHEPDRERRGSWIAKDKEAKSLALMFSVFSFDIGHIETIIAHRNNFVKQRRKHDKESEGEYWREYRYFKAEQIPTSYQIPQTETDLPDKLKTLGMVERYFFLNDYAQRFNPQYWDGLSSTYKSRYMGIHEPAVRKKLIDLGLFAPSTDIESVLHVYGKSEFAECATNSGFELKKSWTAKKIYEHLTASDAGKLFLQQLVADKQLVTANEQYRNDINKLIAYSNQISNAIELLCFI